MKNTRIVMMAALGLTSLAMLLRADPDTPDPNLQVDPDGVPLSLAKPQAERLTPEEVAEFRKKQAQAALDKDWLIRDYEKQLKLNAGGDQSGNIYYQLSSNKELAKLAGLPELDDGTDDGTSSNRTGETRSHLKSTLSRSSAPSGSGGSILAGSSYLKPFITPLSGPNGDVLSGFYSSEPTAASSSANTTPKEPASALDASENPGLSEDSSDLETPGMVAADKNPTPDPLDLSLDVLPGESIEHARDHQDDDQLLTLPLPMSADQLHRQQAASVGPPNPFGQVQAAGTTTAKPMPVYDDNEPIPASKAPVINPVRAPIANPYDILNR